MLVQAGVDRNEVHPELPRHLPGEVDVEAPEAGGLRPLSFIGRPKLAFTQARARSDHLEGQVSRFETDLEPPPLEYSVQGGVRIHVLVLGPDRRTGRKTQQQDQQPGRQGFEHRSFSPHLAGVESVAAACSLRSSSGAIVQPVQPKSSVTRGESQQKKLKGR